MPFPRMATRSSLIPTGSSGRNGTATPSEERDSTGSTLVVFDKQRSYIGAFWHESTLPAVASALRNLHVQVTPLFELESACDPLDGRSLEFTDGSFRFDLPATDYAVIELKRKTR